MHSFVLKSCKSLCQYESINKKLFARCISLVMISKTKFGCCNCSKLAIESTLLHFLFDVGDVFSWADLIARMQACLRFLWISEVDPFRSSYSTNGLLLFYSSSTTYQCCCQFDLV